MKAPEETLVESYSWVRMIMCLLDSEVKAELRKNSTKAFKHYKSMCKRGTLHEVNAVEHRDIKQKRGSRIVIDDTHRYRHHDLDLWIQMNDLQT